MTQRLQGKAIIVTGAGSGIGRATADILARNGTRLLLTDLQADAVEASARDIRAGGGEAIAVRGDVGDEESVATFVHAAHEAYGAIDGLFANAGIGGAIGPFADMSQEQFRAVLDVNLVGVFLCVRHVLPLMYAQGHGSIVCTGSIASERGLPGTSGYNVSKHGVLGLVRSVAAESAQRGVRINAVLPGMVDTRMLRTTAGTMIPGTEPSVGVQTMGKAVSPLARAAQPEEIGEAVAFLLSDAASYVHGVGLPVDGGALATMGNGGESD